MNKVALAGAAFFAFAAAPAFAQPAEDGPMTKPQLQAMIKAHFDERDANHDGFLTRNELGERADRALERMDSDKDGRLSVAEAGARILSMFDMADANHDGIVTIAERDAAQSAMAAAHSDHGPAPAPGAPPAVVRPAPPAPHS